MRTDPSIFSRRLFLGACATAGGFVLMGGGAMALRGGAPSVGGLRILTDHEFRTLSALARALFPAGGPIPAGADDADLARRFDAFLADEPSWNQSDLKKALFLLEFGPVIFDRCLTAFSNLSDDERLAHFSTWQTSGIVLRRQVAVALQRILSMLFYDNPQVWPHIGYDGPLIKGAP